MLCSPRVQLQRPPRRRGFHVAALLLAWACGSIPLTAGAVADTVARRGGAPPLQGEVTGLDDEGVRLRTPLGAEQVVPWDRVREVQTQRSWPHLAARLERAEHLWRARSRVERGDTTMAEPLLERLFEETRGRTGETALVVAEGLLRCRLARGEHVGAVIPALEVARLRRAGVGTMSYANLAPVLDEATQLCPVLPPVLPAGPTVERLRLELSSVGQTSGAPGRGEGAPVDPVIRALAQAYAAALVLSPDGSLADVASPTIAVEENESKSVRDHPGVALLRGLLATTSGTSQDRRAARQRLEAAELRLPWQRAWRHFFMGASLISKEGEDAAARQRGAIELLHLPAHFASTQPWLSGLALRLVSEQLRLAGEDQDAAVLRRELETLHPHHPLRPTGRWPSRSAATPAPSPAGPSSAAPSSSPEPADAPSGAPAK